MHAYLVIELKVGLSSEEHADVGSLMSCMREYPGLREPAVRIAGEDVICALEQVGERQVALGEQKVCSRSTMLFKVHGGQKLYYGARRT